MRHFRGAKRKGKLPECYQGFHLVKPSKDRLQSAYQPHIGVTDTVIHLLHRSISHFERTGNTVRIMFFKFSIAFNTASRCGQRLISWTISPTDHSMLDYWAACQMCSVVQGLHRGWTVQHLTDTYSSVSVSCHLNSAVVGCITDEEEDEYRNVMKDFVQRCQRNNLQLNTSKTKEVDLCKKNRTGLD